MSIEIVCYEEIRICFSRKTPLLENYSGIQTRNADRVRAALFGELGATYFDLPNGSGNFSVNLRWCKRDNLTLVNAICGDGTDVKYPPATFVRQYFELDPAARVRFSFGRRSLELSYLSPPVVVPANTPLRIRSTARHNMLLLRLEQHALNRQIEYLLGKHISGDINFEQSTEKTSPKHHLMRDAVIQFISELDVLGPTIPSLARIELEQVLITKFLLLNEHNFSRSLSIPDAKPSLSQLRRVEEYLAANWDKSLDMELLVKITNVSSRTIFRHFKNMRGVSPLNFVKSVRLRHMRQILQNAAPDASVMTIALNCGFQSLGHFSREYRRAFGELPSDTLHRSRSAKN